MFVLYRDNKMAGKHFVYLPALFYLLIFKWLVYGYSFQILHGMAVQHQA